MEWLEGAILEKKNMEVYLLEKKSCPRKFDSSQKTSKSMIYQKRNRWKEMARFSSDCKKMRNYQEMDRSNEVKFFLVVAEWLEDGLTSSEEESSEEGRISQKRGSWKIEDRRRQSSRKTAGSET